MTQKELNAILIIIFHCYFCVLILYFLEDHLFDCTITIWKVKNVWLILRVSVDTAGFCSLVDAVCGSGLVR